MELTTLEIVFGGIAAIAAIASILFALRSTKKEDTKEAVDSNAVDLHQDKEIELLKTGMKVLEKDIHEIKGDVRVMKDDLTTIKVEIAKLT